MGFLRSDQKALENILEHKGYKGDKAYAGILYAYGKHLGSCPQSGCDICDKDIPYDIKDRPAGYDKIYQVATEDELNIALNKLRQGNGLRLLIAKAAIGARVDLGRPTSTPKSNKVEFMKKL